MWFSHARAFLLFVCSCQGVGCSLYALRISISLAFGSTRDYIEIAKKRNRISRKSFKYGQHRIHTSSLCLRRQHCYSRPFIKSGTIHHLSLVDVLIAEKVVAIKFISSTGPTLLKLPPSNSISLHQRPRSTPLFP